MKIKHLSIQLLKALALSIAMIVSFVAASAIANPGAAAQSATQSPDEAAQAGMALLIVCTVNALLLMWPIARSRWHGWRLVGAMGLVFFGVQTFMSQIETVFFGSAFNIPQEEMTSIIFSGLLTAIFFTPLAVLILGKLRTPKAEDDSPASLGLSRSGWVKRLALLPGVYVVLYFLFGYFIAWQSPDVRLLYSGSTDIRPFFEHMGGILANSPELVLFQYVRGLLWIGLALPILRLMAGTAWEKSIVVGLLFGLLITTQLLFPNPYMAAPVRLAHFVETAT
ncbi:MAG TPA: hypothetical protein PL105_07105, partial [Caldilineaceae bacterium]|nr:hypothetical protein [Caldilineaceae bacterium]